MTSGSRRSHRSVLLGKSLESNRGVGSTQRGGLALCGQEMGGPASELCYPQEEPYGPKLAPDLYTLERRKIPEGTVAVRGLPGLSELAPKGLRMCTEETSLSSEPCSPPLQAVADMTVASEIC